MKEGQREEGGGEGLVVERAVRAAVMGACQRTVVPKMSKVRALMLGRGVEDGCVEVMMVGCCG